MSDAPPSASPVFVDPTGRRRRRVRVAALTTVASLAVMGAVVVVALLGVPVGPSAYLPQPVPGTTSATNEPPRASTETVGGPVGSPTGPRPAPRTALGPVPVAAPTAGPPTTTTSPTKGKPETPPGRPTDLPSPPGHTH
jgi:hypothetical protein